MCTQCMTGLRMGLWEWCNVKVINSSFVGFWMPNVIKICGKDDGVCMWKFLGFFSVCDVNGTDCEVFCLLLPVWKYIHKNRWKSR